MGKSPISVDPACTHELLLDLCNSVTAGEHLQYSLYAKYTESLWAKEVKSAARLGNASTSVMHACGVENPFHAGDIIAQSKALGKIVLCSK